VGGGLPLRARPRRTGHREGLSLGVVGHAIRGGKLTLLYQMSVYKTRRSPRDNLCGLCTLVVQVAGLLRDADEVFEVKPPLFSLSIFPLIEQARVAFVKAATSSRSGESSKTITCFGREKGESQGKLASPVMFMPVIVPTSVGKAHVLCCPGRGTYPAAVLVHGVCSCAHDYYPLITRLQKVCKAVFVVDLPGRSRDLLLLGSQGQGSAVMTSVFLWL
jgi:hypothetical protein